ncbi:MAG: radical SAM family heme chaperone HemW [Pseudomonadota bacterium]
MRPGIAVRPDNAGLYVHVPFCSAVCPYCDFAVSVARPGEHAAFLSAVSAEAHNYRDWPLPFDTVYFGGGTPSALSGTALQELLATLRAALPIAPDARVFLEANPEDITPAYLGGVTGLGVHTLSLGVQSFDDRELRLLGRRHTGAQALEAVRRCLAAGIHTVSVDVIFGLPGQSRAELEVTLRAIEQLRPHHVSCYQLTIHEGTNFHRRERSGRLTQLEEDRQAELYEYLTRRLAECGLQPYEVSNFARAPQFQSLHNNKYWRHVPYLGLGPSAHSFDGSKRWWNLRNHRAYADALTEARTPVDDCETLEAADLALETLMLGIRTAAGIDLDAYRERFAVDLASVNAELLSELCALDYVECTPASLAPTPRGMAVADALAAQLDTGL